MLWPSDVLPTPGRADEAQDRAAALGIELAHGEVLEDALLDLLEAVVIGVEDPARPRDVDVLRVELRPRQRDQRVEVSAHHRVLAARLGHALEALQLLARVLLDFRRHAGLGDRLAQLGEFLAASAPRRAPSGSGFICSRSTISRCRSSIASLVCCSIWRDSFSTSTRWVRCVERPFRAGRVTSSDLEDLLLLGGLDVQEARDRVGERRGRLDALQRRRRVPPAPAAAARSPRRPSA